jgi:hypothetical protein
MGVGTGAMGVRKSVWRYGKDWRQGEGRRKVGEDQVECD